MAKSDTIPKKLDGYGQAPANPATHAIYCYYPPRDQLEPGQHRNIVVLSFKLFAAKRFFEIMTEGTEVEPIGDNRVMAANNIEVYCPQGLKQVIEYKYKNDAERDWMPQEDHADQINRIRKRLMDEPERVIERDEDGKVIKPERVKKEKAEKPAKPTRAGLIDMSVIAAELKVDAKDCRNAMRKAKYPKPDLGWCFTEAQVPEVKGIITKFLETKSKK